MEETLLLEKLHDLRKRLRQVLMLQAALAWCFPGALTTLILVFVLKLLDRPQGELTLATMALVLFPLGGAVAAGLRKLPIEAVALLVDRKLDLKERLTTALEWVRSDRPRTVIAQRLIRDASQHAAGVEPKNTFKTRIPASLRKAALLSALASLLLLIPPWHLFQPRQSEEEIRVVKRASEDLLRKAQQLRKLRPNSKQAQGLADRLEELAKRLQEPGTDRQEAAARVANLAEQLRSQSRQQGQGQGDERGGTGTSSERSQQLRQLARKARKDGATEDLKKAIEEAKKQAEPGSEERKALDRAQQAAQKGDAQQAAQDLAEAAQAAEDQAVADQGMTQEVADTLQQCESELSQNTGQGQTQAQQGQGQGQAPGQGQQAPGQQVGQNQGGTGEKGKGEAPADFGKGTTNQDETGKGGGQEGKDYNLNRQSDKTSDWEEEYKQLYASERVHRDTADTNVKGQVRPGEMLPGQGQVRGAPKSEPGVGTGAEEVYLDYKREAEEAVTRQTVPAEYRDLVRSYFDGIDPREGK